MKKNLDSVDLAKLIGSILIFAMHCNVLSAYPQANFVLKLLSRWGVPFFFICSAYFLFGKGEGGGPDGRTVRAYGRRIGLLYAAWFVYNLPNTFYLRLYGRDLSAVGTWLTFIKNAALSSTYTGSWYLVSSAFSAWLVYRLGKRLGTGAVLGLTSIPYLLCALTSTYYGLLPPAVAGALDYLCFPLNIFNGCFYFALGKAIRENEARLTARFTRNRALLGFIAAYAVLALEIALARRRGIFRDSDVALSTALIVFFLFLYCLQASPGIRRGRLLRQISTVVYCCQGNVLLANSLFKRLGLPSGLAFMASAMIVAAICAVVLRLQRVGRWKWAQTLT